MMNRAVQETGKGISVPRQYATGEALFMGMRLTVTPRVFIPRPETELLTRKAAELAIAGGVRRAHVLELCTGSGAVSVGLATLLEGSVITATDIDPEALEVAERNIKRHVRTSDVRLVESDLYEALAKEEERSYDLILANPPYVSDFAYRYLLDEWVRQEPRRAFLAGEDGLDVIGPIIARGCRYLRRGGHLVLEVGYDQALKVKALFRENGYGNISSCHDENGFERVIWGRCDG